MLNRRFIVSCLVASIWIAPAVIAKEKSKLLANSSKSISFDNNELIVALLLRKDTPLSGSVIAYAKGDDIALPFEQLMFLLEFPIKSTNKGKQAKGWFIRKNNRFSLDLNAKKVISNGKSFQVNQSDLLIVKGELFVPSQLLSQWFPLDFKANLRSLDVIITPRQSIAIDERTTRKKKKFGVVYQVKSNLPERRTPYKAFSIPALELKFGVGYNSKSKSSLSSNYSIRSSSDLAFMHSDLFLAGSERKLTDARILLSRHDPRGRLLGRLDATIFEVGDISTRAIPLIRSNVTGRGLKIARHPLEYASGLEKITLEGSIELGYDLELYRNDILVDAIYSSQTTRYKFKDLKLFGGKNVFRLEFYGKQGQRRTKVKNYTAGAGQVRKGELLYNFAVYQANRSVFDIDKSLFNTGLLNNTSNSKKINIDASIDYGVNSNLTFTVGMSSRHEGNRSTTYGFSGIRTRLGRYFVNVDAATKNTGGSALGLAITTTVKKLDFSAKYEQYFSNFLAGAITEGSRNVNLKSLASIDVSSNSIKTGKNTYFNFGVGLNSSKLVNGNLSYSLDNRLGIRVSRANFTNSLSYSYSPQTKNKRLRGSSKLSFGFNRFGGGALRLGLDYEIKPKKQLRTANISISKRLASLYSTSLSYTEDFIDDSKKVKPKYLKGF